MHRNTCDARGFLSGVLVLVVILMTLTSKLLLPATTPSDTHPPQNVPSPGVEHQAAGIVLHPEWQIDRKPVSLFFQWNISQGIRAPDGVKKRVYLVNSELRLLPSFHVALLIVCKMSFPARQLKPDQAMRLSSRFKTTSEEVKGSLSIGTGSSFSGVTLLMAPSASPSVLSRPARHSRTM
jgi:hypothetical protein